MKEKIDTTCLELNLNLWTEPATDKKFTHRCEFAVNSARHWAYFDMNKKQSSLRPPMSCVLLVYANFSLLIFSNHFLQKTTFVSTSWIVVNVLREAWQDLRPKLCESSNEEAGLLSAPKKNLHISRGLIQHVWTTTRNSSADRTHPLHQSLIFAPFLLNLLLNAASVNLFRNVIQLMIYFWKHVLGRITNISHT